MFESIMFSRNVPALNALGSWLKETFPCSDEESDGLVITEAAGKLHGPDIEYAVRLVRDAAANGSVHMAEYRLAGALLFVHEQLGKYIRIHILAGSSRAAVELIRSLPDAFRKSLRMVGEDVELQGGEVRLVPFAVPWYGPLIEEVLL